VRFCGAACVTAPHKDSRICGWEPDTLLGRGRFACSTGGRKKGGLERYARADNSDGGVEVGLLPLKLSGALLSYTALQQTRLTRACETHWSIWVSGVIPWASSTRAASSNGCRELQIRRLQT
jgi:hypothetical protein